MEPYIKKQLVFLFIFGMSINFIVVNTHGKDGVLHKKIINSFKIIITLIKKTLH